MSAIYFHTPSGDARLQGLERHWMVHLCRIIMLGVLDLDNSIYLSHPLSRLFPNTFGNSLDGHKDWALDVKHHVTFGTKESFRWKDERVSWFSVMLNTALTLGSSAIQLASRLHGQSELHAYVEGPNRAWLADLIRRGRKQGVFRDAMGWEDVIALLESSSTKPVVTSFSGSNPFPDIALALEHKTWTPPAPDALHLPDVDSDPTDAWYNLTDYEQWEYAMLALRAENQHSRLELKPDDWDTYHFGTGLTALDIMRHPEELTAA